MKWLQTDDNIDQALATAPAAPPKEPSFWNRLAEPLAMMGRAQIASSEAHLAAAETLARPVHAAIDEVSSPGFLDHVAKNIDAQFHEGLSVTNSDAESFASYDAYQTVVDAVNKGRPADKRVWNPLSSGLGWTPGAPSSNFDAEAKLWGAVAEMKRHDPGGAANLPSNPAEFHKAIQDAQRPILATAEKTASESGPIARFAGMLVGGGAAGFADPINIAAMGLGASASNSLLRTFLYEGALNTAADAVVLPDRTSRLEDLGVAPPSAGDIAAEFAGDFLLGGAIPTSIKALGRGSAQLVAAFDKRFPNPGDDARTARNAVADMARRKADAPYTPTDQGVDTYRQNLMQHSEALDARITPPPAPELRPGDVAIDPAWLAKRFKDTYEVQSFRPSELQTDAAAMQYKRGGDTSGVTGALKGVSQWDDAAGGMMLVWQRADGANIVANGHQRLGLATGLEASGHPPINLYARVLREADGYTAQDARVRAALVNIREGSGEALDAARVLRDAPESDAGLPPRSPLVARARDLVKLQGDAWDMAWNGVASERDAALVGRHVTDPQMQTALLAYLGKVAPDSAQEAELIVRQAVAAGARKSVQTDMFGDFLKSDLILPERVAILHSALTTLRKDKALFATLTKRETAIEDAGNVLAPEENARRQQQAAEAFATIKALAERKGEISDALQAAAEKSLAGKDRRGATRDFVAAVRRTMDAGGSGFGSDREPIGDVFPATEAASTLARDGVGASEKLELFADPAKDRTAFDEQSKVLAHELAPVTSKPVEKINTASPAPSEFGAATPEIEALRALPQDLAVPDMDHLELFSRGEKPLTLKKVVLQTEREARTVETLRTCLEGGA